MRLWILPVDFSRLRVVGRLVCGMGFRLGFLACAFVVLDFLLGSYCTVVSCVSHGPVLTPRNPGDMPEGSRVLGQTQLQRDRLLNEFGRWLKEDDLSLEALIGMAEVDIEF